MTPKLKDADCRTKFARNHDLPRHIKAKFEMKDMLNSYVKSAKRSFVPRDFIQTTRTQDYIDISVKIVETYLAEILSG